VRDDVPETDPALDLRHAVLEGDSAKPRFERWD
jgi:hypothetical protein